MKNHNFTYFLPILTFSVLLLLSGCNGTNSDNSLNSNPQLVAEVNDDYPIYFPRVQQYHSDNEFGVRFPDSELFGYEEVLDILITNRLKQIDFFETEMHRDPNLRREIQRIVAEEVFNHYFEEEHLSKYINEQTKREYFNGMKKEFHYRQIVLPQEIEQTDEGQAIDETINDILEALNEGEEFQRLIELYSQSQNAGRSHSVRWSPERTSPLFNQLYNLMEGDVKVLETTNSFIIIKIDRVEQVEIPDYEHVLHNIRQNLRNMHGNKAWNEFENQQRSLVSRENIEWNEEGMQQLTEWASQTDFFTSNYRETLQNAIDDDQNIVFLNYEYGSVDIEEFLRILDEVLIMNNPGRADVEQLKKFLVEALRRDQIVKKGYEMGLDEGVLTAENQSPTLRNQVIRVYNQENIDKQVPEPDSNKLIEFFETYRDSIFYEPARVNIFALIYDEPELAEDALNRYENGTEFESLERGYAVRTFIRNREGEIESFLRREPPYLGETAFSIDENVVYGPVEYEHQEDGRKFALIKSVRNQPERYLTFEEAGDKVEEEFRKYHRQKISDSVKTALWDKYPVTLYRENLIDNIRQ